MQIHPWFAIVFEQAKRLIDSKSALFTDFQMILCSGVLVCGQDTLAVPFDLRKSQAFVGSIHFRSRQTSDTCPSRRPWGFGVATRGLIKGKVAAGASIKDEDGLNLGSLKSRFWNSFNTHLRGAEN
jgi:hypothetical protein